MKDVIKELVDKYWDSQDDEVWMGIKEVVLQHKDLTDFLKSRLVLYKDLVHKEPVKLTANIVLFSTDTRIKVEYRKPTLIEKLRFYIRDLFR